ncbi:MerR family transcriptional regulator [Rhodococcus sp. T2V]|uniref:MerR family transcriptional regulator n=1 Tax=Rhodococcus sp. T2V TaxID=3034164 RepID=UPI0023E33CC7|nr:MerR family transcriptional regulator [Rhodococcus sp. T2V]MDF3313324.1 MerR family transcriptional regulator [Rhodococcus sp. T2V]
MSLGSGRYDPGSPSLRGVYGISVAAELSGFGIAALRLYEDYGLLTPGRTSGGTRRYSDYDLARLRRIAELIDAGVNLVGIGRVLDLELRTDELERDNRRLEADNAHLRAEQDPETVTDHTGPARTPDDDAVRDRPPRT